MLGAGAAQRPGQEGSFSSQALWPPDWKLIIARVGEDRPLVATVRVHHVDVAVFVPYLTNIDDMLSIRRPARTLLRIRGIRQLLPSGENRAKDGERMSWRGGDHSPL